MPTLTNSLRPFASLLVSALLLSAIPIRPAMAGVDRWTAFGPGGGTVVSLTVDPTAPKTVYALVAPYDMYSNPAIFKSTDGAVSWVRSWAGLPGYLGLHAPYALALDPSRPWVLYTAACPWGTGWVYQSPDGGGHWVLQTPAALSAGGSGVTDNGCLLAVAPGRPGLVYFALGTRLLRSADGGIHWTELFRAAAEIRTLLVDPLAPGTLYVGTAPGGGGLWRSTDRGRSFTVAVGLESVEALAASRARPRLYLASGGAIYSSQDGKAWSWTGEIGGSVTALAVDALSPSTVYAGHDHGISVSRDGGATWTVASRGLPSVPRTDSGPPYSVVKVLALAASPGQPGTVYAGTELTGVFQTHNGGQLWLAGDQRGLNGTWLNRILFNPLRPGSLCVTESGGPHDGLWCSANGGQSWTLRSTALDRGFRFSDLQFDPVVPDTLYATAGFGSDVRGVFRSSDGGVTWTGLARFDLPPSAVAVTGQGTLIVATENGLFRSTDDGRSWSATSLVYRWMSLSMDPNDLSTVYAWLPGAVYWSRDAGLTWKLCIAGPSTVTTIPGMPGTLYAFIQNQSGETPILRSLNGGDSWSEVAHFQGAVVSSLVVDGTSPETLYVGTTERGIFRSTDGGATWAPVNQGLPPVGYYPVLWLFAHPTIPHTLFAEPLAGAGLFVARFPQP